MLQQPIDNEQLFQKRNKAIKQKPGSTTKQPEIGKRPENEEQVGENVVRVPKLMNRKPNEFLIIDYETGNLFLPQEKECGNVDQNISCTGLSVVCFERRCMNQTRGGAYHEREDIGHRPNNGL
jgi:hypothetical protein